MIECKIGIYLGYLMAIYTISSMYYLIATSCIGTPFKDSLTEKQIAIKKQSAKLRKNIFLQGIGIGIVLCLVFRPFRKC
tara:strand:- start:734 stop:970 length:237 start_codon:yes stop_codon:yes gene_type:complete